MAISLTVILLYLNGKLRPIVEGEAVFKAGHIILCGFQKDAEEKKLVVLCLQTSNLEGAPHNINITLKTNVDEWQATCSCNAGQSGSCKHIIATLIYANRHEELQEISCTDITQGWGASGSSSADYSAPVTILEYCHTKVKKRKTDAYVPSQEELSELQNKAFDIV